MVRDSIVLPAELWQPLDAWAQLHLAHSPSASHPVGVAFSGGGDSTALLWACHLVWPGGVLAIHVNHGLQQAASVFSEHCARVCVEAGIPLVSEAVCVSVQPGDSVEERARQTRYAVLSRVAQDRQLQVVLLAQHAQDQAESVMLALSRGAGVAGIAGMGAMMLRHGAWFGRPWLSTRQSHLHTWLSSARLTCTEDPSNADLRYTRNKIRTDVMPGVERAFPHWVDSLARSARHAAQAAGLLDELAAADLVATGSPPQLRALQSLSNARQANLLRYWLRECAGRAPTTAQLDALLLQIKACTTRGHRIHIKVCTGWVERRGDLLHYHWP